MRCFCCSFHGEDELESRLVALWVWIERTQIETPLIEIRQDGSTGGTVMMWLDGDGHHKELLPMWRDASPYRAPILGRCDRRSEASATLRLADPRDGRSREQRGRQSGDGVAPRQGGGRMRMRLRADGCGLHAK